MPAGLKSLRVTTAGSLTKPSTIAAQRVVDDDVLESAPVPAAPSTNGVAVNSSPRIGFKSLIAFTPALAR